MMGKKERIFSPLPRNVSLEDLVPEDNFYRRLDRVLDLSFVRDLVKDRYAATGRPSVDPQVFFRLQLVMFFEDIRSERQLMEVAADRLSIRWFLGYDLHEPLPDHSSLTRIRERYGLEIFRCFFERIVEECFEAGLVWGEELFFDATKVEANAAVDSLSPRWAVEAHLEGLIEEEEAQPQADDEQISEKGREIAQLPTACEDDLRERNATESDWISRAGRQDRYFKSGYRPRTSDSRASTTDPDATPMTWAKSGSRLGYQVHHVVDGGKARIVLNVLVTPSEVTENRPMLDLLWSTIFRWRIKPRQVTGDAKYGTRQNVAALEKAGEGWHSGVRSDPQLRLSQYRPLRPRTLPLRSRKRSLPLPSRANIALPQRGPQQPAQEVLGEALDLQRLRAQSEVHLKRPRPRAVPTVRRRLLR